MTLEDELHDPLLRHLEGRYGPALAREWAQAPYVRLPGEGFALYLLEEEQALRRDLVCSTTLFQWWPQRLEKATRAKTQLVCLGRPYSLGIRMRWKSSVDGKSALSGCAARTARWRSTTASQALTAPTAVSKSSTSICQMVRIVATTASSTCNTSCRQIRSGMRTTSPPTSRLLLYGARYLASSRSGV